MFGFNGRIGPRSFWTESARIPTETHLKNLHAFNWFLAEYILYKRFFLILHLRERFLAAISL